LGFVQDKIAGKLVPGKLGDTVAENDWANDKLGEQLDIVEVQVAQEDEDMTGDKFRTLGPTPYAESIRYNFPKYTGNLVTRNSQDLVAAEDEGDQDQLLADGRAALEATSRELMCTVNVTIPHPPPFPRRPSKSCWARTLGCSTKS
jgi:hypothetical protein